MQKKKCSGANKWQKAQGPKRSKSEKAGGMTQGIASLQPMLKRLLPVLILGQLFIGGLGGQTGRYDLYLCA